MVFAPQETYLQGTLVQTVPLWQDQEENPERCEVARRKAKASERRPFLHTHRYTTIGMASSFYDVNEMNKVRYGLLAI
jgi:hypothetical protein